MNSKIREYLEKMQQANAGAIEAERKLNIHNEAFEQKILEERRTHEINIAPILTEIKEKRTERDKYGQQLKDVLVVNIVDLIKELDRKAKCDYFDNARYSIQINELSGHRTREEIANMMETDPHLFRNAFHITFNNQKYCVDKKFLYCKSLNLDNNIKFSDGSSLLDNLVIVPYTDGQENKHTRLCLTADGERKLMVSFMPEELFNDAFMFRPVQLLRDSILSILENKPTM